MRLISASGVEVVEVLRLLEPELAGTEWMLGYRLGAAEPWVRIRAIDGGACDVISNDGAVIDRVMACFATVVEVSTSGT